MVKGTSFFNLAKGLLTVAGKNATKKGATVLTGAAKEETIQALTKAFIRAGTLDDLAKMTKNLWVV